MDYEDARKLTGPAQEEKRKQAIRLYQQGWQYKSISEVVGVHFETIGKWVRLYRSMGLDGIKARKQGRYVGSGNLLSVEQTQQIKEMITDKMPYQLKMPYALWTRKAVKELIATELGVKISIRTTGNYLSKWGFTPQKPLKRAYEQNPEKVKQWLDVQYPMIKAKAKKEEAEIYWGDETGLRSDHQRGRGYAPKGQTPIITVCAKRTSSNMISAINNQGKVRFQIYNGTMNAKLLIGFMKRLIKGANKKVILILDNLRVHHAKIVKSWLAEHDEAIEVFYLPAYSPELNPDEYLNCDLKAGVHSTSPARDNKQLKSKIRSHMCMLQKRPQRVPSYFKHPKIKYAA